MKPKPTKVCQTCGRPMEWRKKWRDVWDDVKYCGERCRRNRNSNNPRRTSEPNHVHKK